MTTTQDQLHGESDHHLLGQYARREPDADRAFAALVDRYVGLVYAAAKRQVGDAHLAQDVTQVVFAILSRKANGLANRPGDNTLGGWLHTTTRYAASNALKLQRRRQRYEQAASRLASPAQEATMTTEAGWEEIKGTLDAAVGRLGAKDREVVVLRYLRGLSLEEVGRAVGTTAEAARKRMERALGRMREDLARRGIALSAGVLAEELLRHGMEATPAGLSQTVAGWAGALAGQNAGQAIMMKGAMTMMTWAKVKIGAVVTAAVVLGTVGSAVVVRQVAAAGDGKPTAATPSVAATTPATAAVQRGAETGFPEIRKGRIFVHIGVPLEAGAGKLVEQAIYDGDGAVFDWRRPAGVKANEAWYGLTVWRLDKESVQKIRAGQGAEEAAGIVAAKGLDAERAMWVAAGFPTDGTSRDYGDNRGMPPGAKNKEAKPLDPGTYLVKLEVFQDSTKATGGTGAVGRGWVLLTVKQALVTQVMVNAIQEDGSIRFENIQRNLNGAEQTITRGGFRNSDFVKVEAMEDGEGKAIAFTETHDQNMYRYSYTLNKAVKPDEWLTLITKGTMKGLVRTGAGETKVYAMNHSPSTSTDCRRLELFTLPKGAEVLSVEPKDARQRVVDGVAQVVVEEVVPVGGSVQVVIRYKMGAGSGKGAEGL